MRTLRLLFTELYILHYIISSIIYAQIVIHLKLSAPQVLVQFKNKLPYPLSGPYNIYQRSIYLVFHPTIVRSNDLTSNCV